MTLVSKLIGRDSPALPVTAPRLGDLLTASGLLSPDQLRAALLEQTETGLRLGATLVSLGLLTERELAVSLAEQSGLELVDLAHTSVDLAVAKLLDEHTATRLVALPVARADGRVRVVVADPYAPGLLDDLITQFKQPVLLSVAAGSDILQTINSVHTRTVEMRDALVVFEKRSEERERNPDFAGSVSHDVVDENAPVVKVLNLVLEQAVRERASDVHIEPQDDKVIVRVRTDGSMHEIMTLPVKMGLPLLSRLKVMSNMNIVERRRPQDGTFAVTIMGRDIDVRVATSPTIFGEMAVLRLLDKSRSMFDLAKLGMPAATAARYNDMIKSPFGLVVCAGPTGAGKTTTLHASLASINDRTMKVATIEDPVEYVIPTISQIQINEAAGVTFATGLRAILRQDPDTILVGEIRDAETARIAVQAALTGHFVLSSIHATDAPAALHRFLDMGIEGFLLASALTGVVGQRLVRRNCPRCAAAYTPDPVEMAFMVRVVGSAVTGKFARGSGCNFCHGTGFFERVGVYEVMVITDEMRELIITNSRQSDVRKLAMAQGMRTLAEQAVELCCSGVTTASEVMRTVAVS